MEHARAWLRRLSVADRVAIGLGVLLVPLFALSNEDESGSITARAVDGWAIAILAAAGLLLLLRRRHPGPVVLAVIGLGTTWYTAGYTNGIVNVPILLAFYELGATGTRRQQVGYGAVGLAIPFLAVVGLARLPVSEAIDAVGYPLAALLTGELVRSRRLLLAEYAEKAAAAEARLETEAERRVAEERLRIAHDVHDVLAHGVAVMAVQAGVAADSLDRDPAAAREALATIRQVGKCAMSEIRATVAVLRGSEPAAIEPAPSLERLAELVEGARAQGLEVKLLGDAGDAGRLDQLVQLTAFRVVQESLTNVMRHAGATEAGIQLDRQRDRLRITVTDDGRGQPPAPGAPPGFGLRGMRERVQSLGGHLEAGPGPEGGWQVTAVLPLGAEP